MNHSYTGCYKSGNSILHKANPFAKLLCLFAAIAAIVLCDSVLGFLAVITFILCIILISGIELCDIFRSLKSLWLFLVIIFLMNAFFYTASNPIFEFGFIRPSYIGIIQGITIIIRLAFTVILADILMAVTTPLEIINAIEALIYPLKYIRVPIRDVSMILGVAMQFIPTFRQEADMIRKAQLARGARFESKKLNERAQSFLPLIIPVFVSAFRRADELSIAMESRGYRRVDSRNTNITLNLKLTDILMLLMASSICLLEIFI